MTATDDQQFCLRWNNFQAYITSQFETLRDDEDFVDVTLACDGQRLGAHKVVLSACSPFFKELFKTNPCPHPIIFMRDVEARHIIALLEFMYAGEVNVAQAHLAGFLKTAESLQIRGLTDASKNHKENIEQSKAEEQTGNKSPSRATPPKTKQKQTDRSPEENIQPPLKKICTNKTDSENERLEAIEETLKVEQMEEIDTQINPFALHASNMALHTEIDITTDLIEPKLELPDYSEDDTNNENSHGFFDAKDVKNTFTNLSGGMEIIPGTSGNGEVSQDSQLAWDTRKLHSLDPRPCPVCGRIYSNLSNLRQHMRLIHNPTHVECPVCSKSFKTTLYLKRHLVICRNNHFQNQNGVNNPIPSPATHYEHIENNITV